MNREDTDDLYTRHQVLAALVSVLVHDLRNPLHSTTLLVEAMGSPSADVNALRAKIRAQVGKLDGLIAETMATMRERAIEPHLETIDLDALLRSLAERASTLKEGAATFELPPASGLAIVADRRLLERTALEIAAVLVEHRGASDAASPSPVIVTIDEPEAGAVRVRLGDLERAYAETLAKAPFAIAGGGIRLAVTRALAQDAGATLRLEQGADSPSRFSLLLRKPQ
jgi:hypothetical protein